MAIEHDKKIEDKLAKLITNINYCTFAYNTTLLDKSVLKTEASFKRLEDIKRSLGFEVTEPLYMIGKPNKDLAKYISNDSIEIPTYSENRKLNKKQEKVLEKYYGLYYKTQKNIDKLIEEMSDLKDYIKGETTKQINHIQTHQKQWDRVRQYVNANIILNNVTKKIGDTEDVKIIVNFFKSNKTINTINVIEKNINKFEKLANIGKEKNVEITIEKGFKLLKDIESLIDGYKDIKGDPESEENTKDVEFNDSLQLEYETKNVSWEDELGRITNDLKNQINELLKKLNGEDDYIKSLKKAFTSLMDSKLVKAMYNTLNEIPFFKNFFELKDNLQDLGKDLNEKWIKVKESIYRSNKAYLDNTLQLALLNDDYEFINYGTGYWLNKIISENLDETKTSKKLQESLQNTLNRYINEGNSNFSPVHPFVRQYVSESKLNRKSAYKYSVGDEVVLILDKKLNVNILKPTIVVGKIKGGFDFSVSKVRPTIDIVYDYENETNIHLKLFVDSYRVWSKAELQAIKDTDKKIRDKFYELIEKNFRNYVSNNSNEQVKETKEFNGLKELIQEAENGKSVTVELLKKGNFLSKLKKAVSSYTRSEFFYTMEKRFENDKEAFNDKKKTIEDEFKTFKDKIDGIKKLSGTNTITINDINNFNSNVKDEEKFDINKYKELKKKLKEIIEIESGNNKSK